jgi:hypothetical protein
MSALAHPRAATDTSFSEFVQPGMEPDRERPSLSRIPSAFPALRWDGQAEEMLGALAHPSAATITSLPAHSLLPPRTQRSCSLCSREWCPTGSTRWCPARGRRRRSSSPGAAGVMYQNCTCHQWDLRSAEGSADRASVRSGAHRPHCIPSTVAGAASRNPYTHGRATASQVGC